MMAGPEAEVRALIENWMDAIRRRDLEGVVAHHAEDVVFYDVPEPVQIMGIDAYRSSWDDFLRWVTTFDTDHLHVVASDDVAFAHWIVRCAGDTEPSPFLVRLTIGCHKVDGRWLITHEHHSVPSPP
jgi:uncharacterized protein (TIGR02246 family)